MPYTWILENATTSTSDSTIRGVTDKWIELPDYLPPIGYIETGASPTEPPVVVDYYRYSASTADKLKVTRTTKNVVAYIPGTRRLALNSTLYDATTQSTIGKKLVVTLNYRPVGEAPDSVV